MHIHVHSASGDAKFWLEPDIEIGRELGLGLR
jgi:hypothetical protein